MDNNLSELVAVLHNRHH